jgi:putative addiction module component (TIGR02574 family)
MASQPEAIFEAALKLSEDERLALVSRLLETLPSEESTLSVHDPRLVEELDRRFSDREGAVPWSELKAER